LVIFNRLNKDCIAQMTVSVWQTMAS